MTADGAAGERWAAALFTAALCAETTHATASEDDDKFDLKVSFEHAFKKNVRVTVHSQVKSGASYLASAGTDRLKLKNVSKESIRTLRAGTSPSVLAWVPPSPRQGVYWYAFRLRRDDTPLEIPRWQRVTPAMRYDLTRIFEHCMPSGRAPRLDVSSRPLPLPAAKKAYKALLGTVEHPLAGRLHVSRHGWRHVTRRSKSVVRRNDSLQIVPYLPNFLRSTPDRFSITCDPMVVEGTTIRRRAWIWCWYDDALRIGNVPHRLLLRFREEIRFPRAWRDRPLAVSEVRQHAVLESWWSKVERD